MRTKLKIWLNFLLILLSINGIMFVFLKFTEKLYIQCIIVMVSTLISMYLISRKCISSTYNTPVGKIDTRK